MAYRFIAARHHGGANGEIRRIVIHGTVSATVLGGAVGVANYFARGVRESSAHYVVDPGEIVQCVADSTIAWHDGTNRNSIGVELCDPVAGPANRWSDNAHISMLVLTSRLVRELCIRYRIPVVHLSPEAIRRGEKGICGHVDMRAAFPGSTTHFDPGPDFPWPTFLHMITQEGPEDDMWPNKMKDYAKDKDHPPMADSAAMMEWTIAKVEWMYRDMGQMKALLTAFGVKLEEINRKVS